MFNEGAVIMISARTLSFRDLARMVNVIVMYLLSGCAGIDFGGEGLTYYDPKPYLFVSTTAECVTTATVVVVPEVKKVMKFKSGYGTAALSATLSNGMISTVGQTTDTKIPETLSAIASLGTAAAAFRSNLAGDQDKKLTCSPEASLYPIVSGVPDKKKGIDFNPKIKPN